MNTIDDDITVQGTIIVETIAVQNASFDDSSMKSPTQGTPVTALKLQHQFAIYHRQPTGTDVASKTEDLHIVYGATGTIVGVEVAATTAPVTSGAPSTDKKFTVDVQVGGQGVAFATVLTAIVSYTNANANCQVQAGTLVASPALVAGSIIRVIVTASGSTGAQAQGLVVTITTREAAQ